MTPEEVTALFTGPQGFRFARWTKPLAPVVFGTDDATLDAIKPAMAEAASLADLCIVDIDPELGANLMLFVLRDWQELHAAKDLEQLIPDLPDLAERLQGSGASRYRRVVPAADGSIALVVSFLRLGDEEMRARNLALDLTVRNLLLWSGHAFEAEPTLAVQSDGTCLVAPRIAALIRAAYDPKLPNTSADPALAYRLAARASMLLAEFEEG
ncbi:hypothetical protein [Halovulum sp. GXIMD14793]